MARSDPRELQPMSPVLAVHGCLRAVVTQYNRRYALVQERCDYLPGWRRLRGVDPYVERDGLEETLRKLHDDLPTKRCRCERP